MDDLQLDIFKFGTSKKLKPGLLKSRAPAALSGSDTDSSNRRRGPLQDTGESSSYSEDYSTNSDEDKLSSSDEDSGAERRSRRRRRR